MRAARLTQHVSADPNPRQSWFLRRPTGAAGGRAGGAISRPFVLTSKLARADLGAASRPVVQSRSDRQSGAGCQSPRPASAEATRKPAGVAPLL